MIEDFVYMGLVVEIVATYGDVVDAVVEDELFRGDFSCRFRDEFAVFSGDVSFACYNNSVGSTFKVIG